MITESTITMNNVTNKNIEKQPPQELVWVVFFWNVRLTYFPKTSNSLKLFHMTLH